MALDFHEKSSMYVHAMFHTGLFRMFRSKNVANQKKLIRLNTIHKYFHKDFFFLIYCPMIADLQ